jgi:hypothetical protein
MQQRGPEGLIRGGQERRRRDRRRGNGVKDVIKLKGGQNVVIKESELEDVFIISGSAQPGAPTRQPTPTRPGERQQRESRARGAEEAERAAKDARRAVGYFLKNLVYPFLEAKGKSEGTEEEIQKLKNYIHENFKKQRKPVGFIENLRKALESKKREGVAFLDLGSPQLTEEDKNKISELLDSNDVIFVFVKEGENVVGFEVIFHLAKTGENVFKGYFKKEYYRSNEEEIKALANQLQEIEKKSQE